MSRGFAQDLHEGGLFGPPSLVCVPGMGIDLEVQVLSELGHRNRSEPQGDDPRGRRRRKRLANPWADVQKSDTRRGGSGRAGKQPRSFRDQVETA